MTKFAIEAFSDTLRMELSQFKVNFPRGSCLSSLNVDERLIGRVAMAKNSKLQLICELQIQ